MHKFLVILILSITPLSYGGEDFDILFDDPMVKFYPNPAKDILHISLDKDIDDVRISICTIIGGEVSVEINRHNDLSYSLQVENLTSGYYLLIIESPEEEFKKVFKFAKY